MVEWPGLPILLVGIYLLTKVSKPWHNITTNTQLNHPRTVRLRIEVTPLACWSQADHPMQERLQRYPILIFSESQHLPWWGCCAITCRVCSQNEELLPSPIPHTGAIKVPCALYSGWPFPFAVTPSCGSGPGLSPTREWPVGLSTQANKNLLPELSLSLSVVLEPNKNKGIWNSTTR